MTLEGKKALEEAAKLGKPMSAAEQLKHVEIMKKQMRERAEMLRLERERAEAQKQVEDKPVDDTPIPKRKRLEMEQQELNQFEVIDSTDNPILQKEIDKAIEEAANKVNNDSKSQFSESHNSNGNESHLNIVNEPAAKPEKLSPMSQIKNNRKKELVTELPSRFLSYPEGAEVYVTPYNCDEIDEISSSKTTLKYLLTTCLEGVYTNFDKNLLTFYDAVYLSYYRRLLTLIEPGDNKLNVTSRCPYCGQYTTNTIDVGMKVEFEDSTIPQLPINVEFSFGKMQFTFLTYKDFMAMETDLTSEQLAYQCLSKIDFNERDGETLKSKLQELFGNCTGSDLTLLQEVSDLTYHGTKPIKTNCKNKECGREFDTQLNDWDSIITPFHSKTEVTRGKISFG